MVQQNRKELKSWLDNRPRSLLSKFLDWSRNPAGALVRLIEILYLGGPLIFLLRAGRSGTLEYISNLPGVAEHLGNSNQRDKDRSPDEAELGKVCLPSLFQIKLHPATGIVRLNSGHFYTNRLEFQAFMSGYHYSDLRVLNKSTPEQVDHKCIPLALQRYYYHFMLEDLPALIGASKAHPDAIILTPTNQPKYVQEALKEIKASIEVTDKKVVRVKELIIPRRVTGTLFEEFKPVVELFGASTPPSKTPQKLLLVRGNRPRGSFTIESKLIDLLAPHGFQIFDPEDSSVAMQATEFAAATHIVSLHGGALTNLIFAKQKTYVFEIHSHLWRNYAFPILAGICQQDYTGADESNYEERLMLWLKSTDGKTGNGSI